MRTLGHPAAGRPRTRVLGPVPAHRLADNSALCSVSRSPFGSPDYAAETDVA